jgi:serine/threonine protein phosphatase PrpC
MMALTDVLAIALVVVAAIAVGMGLALRRDRESAWPREPDGIREQPAGVRAELPPTQELTSSSRLPAEMVQRQLGLDSPAWATAPDLQPATPLDLVATSTPDQDWPPGLAVTAATVGPAAYPQQSVYYVQRNLIALACGLGVMEVGQRAAALALSAVMTSRLGRAPDADQALRDAARSAHRLVRSISGQSPEYSNMVTTLDVVFLSFDGDRPLLHFAHAGNSSIWRQRAGSASVDALTTSHTIDGGAVLRAVGLGADLEPDVEQEPVDVGDRIFLTTASRSFAVSRSLMDAVAGLLADQPLPDVVAELAAAVTSSGAAEEVVILGGEVARPGLFLA